MHMADALLSTPVALVMVGLSAAALAGAGRSLRRQPDDRRVPLMGVLGAFVFALQMVNFAIPGTGASGHLGGGLLLAILLGPAAALVAMTSVLVVQALCFGDGGLLALGANIFNLGVLPCLVAYPLVYRPLAGTRPGPRQVLAAVVAALVALQLGALGVVLQTGASGIAGLSMATFAWLMLPIHAAIGLAEGLATAALVRFLQRSAPEWLPAGDTSSSAARGPQRTMIRRTAAATVFTAAVLSALASPLPDGLEWSLAKSAGPTSLATTHAAEEAPASAMAGLVGSGLTLLAMSCMAAWLRRRRPQPPDA